LLATFGHLFPAAGGCVVRRAQAFELLKRQQQLETMLAEVQGTKPPELLLETTEELLARMKAKLVKS
jgi:hypothetical protein